MTLNCYILSFRDCDTACLTRMAVVHSKISFENFDPHKALAYLVIVAGREALIEAGLRHLIPRWLGDRETALKVTGDAGRNMDNSLYRLYPYTVNNEKSH